MTMTCENCGTKLDQQVCPNCEQEFYVFAIQMDREERGKASPEFMEKVHAQEQKRLARVFPGFFD